jgi:predicted transcriptional regulator
MKKTRFDIALEMISLLKKENEKMSALLPEYKSNINDIEEMYFLSKLLQNEYIKKDEKKS